MSKSSITKSGATHAATKKLVFSAMGIALAMVTSYITGEFTLKSLTVINEKNTNMNTPTNHFILFSLNPWNLHNRYRKLSIFLLMELKEITVILLTNLIS